MSEPTMLVIDPTGKLRDAQLQPSSRPAGIEGATVGFLDNCWWSWGVVVERYKEILKERYGVGEVIHLMKRKPGLPVPSETFEELAAKCDVIINGLGN